MTDKNHKQKPTDEDRPEDKFKDFDININEFGEVLTSVSIDQINRYLNDTVTDKKLLNRKIEEEE